MILEQTNGSEELKALSPRDLKILAQEIRTLLIEKISHAGGHLASSLDAVELTIALFETLNLPEDKVIWNAGHQSYTHKTLNRHMAEFDELHQYGGLSGFPKRKESPYDSFDTGHSSTSISAGLDIALGRDIRGEDYRAVSIIGDGALTGSMAYEALNDAARMEKNFIIMLDDNKMSISENVGGMSRYLDGLRTGSGYNNLKKSVAGALDRVPVMDTAMIDKTRRTKNSIKQLSTPGMLFGNMDITYLDPVSGHNIQALCRALREAQKLDHAVLVHVMTKEGGGYRPVERNPSCFHGMGPLDIKTGKSPSAQTNPSYTDMFSGKLCQLEEEHPELVAVTTAMPDDAGLAAFGKKFPDRFFGMGIAEARAVTSAANMAAAGLRPVVAVYSSFLQRAYSQVLHDVCIQNLPVFFAVDQTGFVGSDGETHQGIFDYSFLISIPNMSVMAPENLWELRVILGFAMDYDSPLTICYPRGEAYRGLKEFGQSISYGVEGMLCEEENTVLPTVSSMINTGEHTRQKLRAEGHRCSLANSRFVKPLDREMVSRLAERHHLIVAMKENVLQGGYGLAVATLIYKGYPEVKVPNIAILDAYVEHGNVSILGEGLGIDSDSTIGTMKAGGYIDQETLGVHPAPDRKGAWVWAVEGWQPRRITAEKVCKTFDNTGGITSGRRRGNAASV